MLVIGSVRRGFREGRLLVRLARQAELAALEILAGSP